jgi:hypothetical protein
MNGPLGNAHISAEHAQGLIEMLEGCSGERTGLVE